MRIDGKEAGLRLVRAEGNILEVEIREPAFSFAMTGFDTRRDLIVRAREEAKIDDSQN